MVDGPEIVFPPRTRPFLTAAGAVAGGSLWLLVEVVPDHLADRGILVLSAFLAGLFVSLLLLTGPARLGRALPVALCLGAVLAGLAFWSSLRFDDVGDFLETGHPLGALFVSGALAVPFLAAWLEPGRPWLSYSALFDLAWAAAIRAAAAALFLGLVWLFLFLSDAVLDLVGLAFIDWFVDAGPAPFVLSGAVLGLGLAVAGEFGAVLSPALPLGLLRLILVPATLVMALFILVLPFRGVSNAFGTLSAATILMVMVIVGAALVSAVIDRQDADASTSRGMTGAARIMSVLMAAFAGLAIYAVWLRVDQYGWSPDRVMAMAVACVVAGYGLGYALAQLGGTRWRGWVRRVNTAVAVAGLSVAALSLTPVLHPQRIAAQSQLARFEAGQIAVDALDLWALDREWGVAGRAASERLRTATNDDALADRFAALDAASSRRAFETEFPPGARADLVADFLDAVVQLPARDAIGEDDLDFVAPRLIESWVRACSRRTPEGNPGCVIFSGDFMGTGAAEQHVLFYLEQNGVVRTQILHGPEAGPGRFGPTWVTEDYGRTTQPALIDDLVEGRVTLEPMSLRALRFVGADLLVLP